jgi:hypothetical protein
MILICLCALQVVFAMPADDGLDLPPLAGNDTRQGLVCLPFGVCEPCPDEAVSYFLLKLVILNLYLRSSMSPFANHLVTDVSYTVSTQRLRLHLMNIHLRMHHHLHLLYLIIRHYHTLKVKSPPGSRVVASSTKNVPIFTNLSLAIFYLLSLLCSSYSHGLDG